MEQKCDIAKRLYKHPDWPDIEAGKNRRIKELRASGLNRHDAGDQAWRELGERYPQEPAKEPPKFDPAEFSGNDSDFVAATLWVFDNLAKSVDAGSAPGAGAWAMLQWARDNQADFFKSIMPKALDIEAKRGGAADELALEEDDECEDIEALMHQAGEGEGFVA